LSGGWNVYVYPLDPVMNSDSLGLKSKEYSLSIDKAAQNILNKINGRSICESSEYAGLICSKQVGIDEFYYASAPNKGNQDTSWPFKSPCDDNDHEVAWYHTHGSFDPKYGIGNETFSTDDFSISIGHGIDGYLATPKGDFRKYNYNESSSSSINHNMPSQCNKE